MQYIGMVTAHCLLRVLVSSSMFISSQNVLPSRDTTGVYPWLGLIIVRSSVYTIYTTSRPFSAVPIAYLDLAAGWSVLF
jgi:hypothetical protein